MGTGGSRPRQKSALVAEYVNACIRAHDHEFGYPGEKLDILRNSDQSSVYLFKFQDEEFEVEIRTRSKSSK